MSYISQDFLQKVAMGQVSGVTPWSKLGFNASLTTTEEDIWSAGGVYSFPTAATAMEVVSDSATDNDKGTQIHDGGATDVDGSTTTLKVTGENFSTTTAVGDLVILDKAGTTPEWGYVSPLQVTQSSLVLVVSQAVGAVLHALPTTS